MGADPTSKPLHPHGAPGHRKWALRFAMLLGAPLAFLLAVEGGLRTFHYGHSTDLFIPDTKPGYLRTNPAFTGPYFPEGFDITPLNFRIARRKEPGHLRVFVLGESAVRGTPITGFGFTSLLGAQLRSAYPDKQVEVYNLGIVAIDSHVVYQMAGQLADLEPDLFVVYMGNNEVVGPYSPGSVNLSVTPPLAVIRASIWVAGTRTGQLIQNLAAWFAGRTRAPIEWHGMSTFTDKTVRGDDPRLGAVYANYEANLRGIVRIASHSGIKVVLATTVANLRDCAPFASIHGTAVSQADLARWRNLEERGIQSWELGQPGAAIEGLRGALSLDPGYAETHFVLGRALEESGDVPGARAEYCAALHWDALRFRPDPAINAIARRVAADSTGDVVLVDSAMELGSDPASKAPLSGKDLLLEHVHFTWEGNVRLARLLAEASIEALPGTPAPSGPLLDGDGCAAAVGFSPFGRLRMLQQMKPIRGKPPFTNQITFGEDQVRYDHDERTLEALATAKERIALDLAGVRSAVIRHPDDPGLLLRLSELQSQAGDAAGTLSSIDRILELEPRTSELLVLRGRALAALQSGPKAEAAIVEAIETDPKDLPSYSALVDVTRDTGNFELCSRELGRALARTPSNGYLHLAHADMLYFHGDRLPAVAECLAVLHRDPSNPDALGRVVSLYDAEGRKDEAFALRKASRADQPLNYENNLELAKAFEERGDENDAVDCLQAAARSGPASAQAHLFIAHHLSIHKQPLAERVELSRALRVARIGDDANLVSKIESTIRQVEADEGLRN